MAPAVQVAIVDAAGTVIDASSPNITIEITKGTGTPSANIAGTLTTNPVAGVAFFSDLTIDLPGSNYTLTARGTGLSSATSRTFNVTP